MKKLVFSLMVLGTVLSVPVVACNDVVYCGECNDVVCCENEFSKQTLEKKCDSIHHKIVDLGVMTYVSLPYLGIARPDSYVALKGLSKKEKKAVAAESIISMLNNLIFLKIITVDLALKILKKQIDLGRILESFFKKAKEEFKAIKPAAFIDRPNLIG